MSGTPDIEGRKRKEDMRRKEKADKLNAGTRDEVSNDKLTEIGRRAGDIKTVAQFLQVDPQISDAHKEEILRKCLESREVLNDMVVLAKDLKDTDGLPKNNLIPSSPPCLSVIQDSPVGSQDSVTVWIP
ncbi:hypothetical protein C349_04849 [Cryptococcus neoformans var. grubii Br795]|nr:hypothetical protein C350_04702 [Cryptococcus neoformans var. grubii MW-RSA36]OXG78234.1 hypothetical protein C349_04849 [Cryptococcus neoformans var. grubii Br795]OXG81826.1 hypothetical protein C346_04758 [Cryptococcus neoformans var. grubii D17-1]OXH50687.1 hypothetical protein J002_04709 [Cryptococcus neoformans var. grubii]